ncbi:MAG: GatB/YqeY domain-containing protein [Patescibacteria group bacterium]|nr:GatB/YqeY domain-containing protein [Patescibacteria group bacterium]
MDISLEEKIEQDLKSALKEKDEIRLQTLRLLRSALKNFFIEKKHQALSDNDVLALIRKELKKRQDSMAAYQQANRADLAQKEKQEAEILQAYLPAMLSEEEASKIIDQIISEGKNDFGPAMKEAMVRLQGRAEGSLVQRLIKEKLDL